MTLTNPRIWIEICNGGFIVQTTDERRDQNKRVHSGIEGAVADVASRLRTYATLARIGTESFVAGQQDDDFDLKVGRS